MALVLDLWPSKLGERDNLLAWRAADALLRGAIRVGKGGNPANVSEATRKVREQLRERIAGLVELVGEEWRRRFEGVDVHAFRMTHRTWAEGAGVHAILVDRQLGHSTPAGAAAIEASRALLASPTGRRHYVDASMLAARRSAEAVRRLLDEAVAARSGKLVPRVVPRQKRKL